MAEGLHPEACKSLPKDAAGGVSLDVRNLCRELNEVPYWDVGVAFGVEPSKLRSIQASSGPGSTEEQWKAEMFHYCLDNECIHTWSDVAQTLRGMKKTKLANKILQIAGLSESENAEAQLTGNDNSLENQAAVALEMENVCEITLRFTTLLMFTCSKLEQNNTNAKMFYLFVATFFSVAARCIPVNGDIVSMFEAISLNKLWDYWNWRPLKAVIKKFLPDDGEAKAKVREYSESFAAYKATTRISEFIRNQHGLLEDDVQEPLRKRARYDPSYFCTFRVKLNVHPTDLMLKYIDELWESLRIEFLLPPLGVLLERVEGNSISITWLFPTPLKEQIIKISSHSEEFFLKNKIIAVYVDDQCVYPFSKCSSVSTDSGSSPSSGQASPSTLAEASTQEHGMHIAQGQPGYECEFVILPPPAFKTKCPICLQILRKPHEATCCGKVFCYACISRVQESSPCCPSCQSEQYQLNYSKNVEQSLSELHVQCENHENGCKWTGELGQYDNHLNLNSRLEEKMNGCQYAKIKCHNGCGEAIPRHRILLHEMKECSDKRDDHTELEKLLHSYVLKLLHEIGRKDERIAELESELITLKTKIHPITPDPHESPSPKVKHELSQKDKQISELESAFVTLEGEVHPITPDPEEAATVVPVLRTIPNFTRMRELNQDYETEPFYTHPEGYKMCLWVFPNGYRKAENTHVSLFTCFMKGEYDNKLKWPFRGNITVQLIDQVQNKNHRERIIPYDKDTSSYARRLIVGRRSEGWGEFELISHESLCNPNCQYLKDDCLKIRITNVEVDKRRFRFF